MASTLVPTEEGPFVAENPTRMRTPVPISSPTPKALHSILRALESGYECELKSPWIDYFSVERRTVPHGERPAPLASPEPLHMEHGIPSLMTKVTRVAEPKPLADSAQWIPRAATDSSLLLSNLKLLVVDDSV